jgi:hypothetical protein
LVGYLEGEGSFCVVSHKETRGARFYHYRQACVSFNSTDRDVAHRAAKLLGNKCGGPRGPYAAMPTAKPFYDCRLLGARAVKLMRALRLSMGKRRKAQITAVLKEVPTGSKKA